jgi:hypothetical protein
MAGSIKLYGPSGYTEIAADVDASDNVLTLPSVAGSLLTAEGGKILQVVRATDSTSRSTTSTSFVDVTGMSITITPQKNTSSIILAFLAQCATSWTSGDEGRGAFQITDSSNNAISGVEDTVIGTVNLTGTGTRETRFPIHMWAYATPATINATTYKLRFRGVSANTMTLQNNFTTAQMYAIEVSA